jgi:hypothetical protein
LVEILQLDSVEAYSDVLLCLGFWRGSFIVPVTNNRMDV